MGVFQSIARQRRVDQPRPSVDASGEGDGALETDTVEEGACRHAAAAVVAVSDHQSARWRLNFTVSRREFVEGDQDASRQRGRLMLPRLADIEPSRRGNDDFTCIYLIQAIAENLQSREKAVQSVDDPTTAVLPLRLRRPPF